MFKLITLNKILVFSKKENESPPNSQLLETAGNHHLVDFGLTHLVNQGIKSTFQCHFLTSTDADPQTISQTPKSNLCFLPPQHRFQIISALLSFLLKVAFLQNILELFTTLWQSFLTHYLSFTHPTFSFFPLSIL